MEIAKRRKGRTSQTINTMRGYFFKCGSELKRRKFVCLTVCRNLNSCLKIHFEWKMRISGRCQFFSWFVHIQGNLAISSIRFV